MANNNNKKEQIAAEVTTGTEIPTGIKGRYAKATIKNKFKMLIMPACVAIAAALFIVTLVGMLAVSGGVNSTLRNQSGIIKRTQQDIVAAEYRDFALVVAAEKAALASYAHKNGDSFEEAVASGPGSKVVSLIFDRGSKEIIASSEVAEGRRLADSFEGDASVFYEHFNSTRQKPPVDNFGNLRLAVGIVEVPDTDYILVACILEGEVIKTTNSLTDRIDALVVRDVGNSATNTAILFIVISFALAAGAAAAACVLIMRVLHNTVSKPAFELVFDINKANESLAEIKEEDESGETAIMIAPTTNTEDELVVIRNAYFQVIDHLKEHIDDVLKLSGLTEKFENSANFDVLTGVYNRRRFFELVTKHAVVAAKKNESTFVVMIDLDFFKKVNDTYGHAAGDEVLKVIAARVKDTVRPYDLFGRYGGEEFIMFISVHDVKNALDCAERIRQIVQEKPVHFEGVDIPVTTSLGMAQAAPLTTFEEALKLADEALYKAKENGRNRVELYSEELMGKA
jgi:diguanylate cyclase (GGDEF)-like protein